MGVTLTEGGFMEHMSQYAAGIVGIAIIAAFCWFLPKVSGCLIKVITFVILIAIVIGLLAAFRSGILSR